MSQTHHEASREVPVVERTDVLVAGGGPAGVGAAIAAGRAGAKVRLIETGGCLGGIWTRGLLCWILDQRSWIPGQHDKGGIVREIIERLERRGAAYPGPSYGGVAYDPEQMKLVLEQMCREANVQVRLHTRIVAAARDERNRLAVALTESKSGREAWAAKVFIDCTGDGDLGAQSGCGFDFGRPAEGPGAEGPDHVGETQPMSLMCLVTGIDAQATAPFHDRTNRSARECKYALLAELRRAGVEPTYGLPTIFLVHRDLFAWMINHEYGASAMDAQSIADATLHARGELHGTIDALRRLGGVWENLRIVATAEQIGVREGRRIRGRYVVTLEDMVEGRRHDDAVCRVTSPIDVHSTSKSRGLGIDDVAPKAQPYDIPYGALVANDVDGLLLAGRCISGDFFAHSSYRTTGNAAAMGEAAGRAAAWCAANQKLPHEVRWPL